MIKSNALFGKKDSDLIKFNMVLISTKPIKTGETITWDYGNRYYWGNTKIID